MRVAATILVIFLMRCAHSHAQGLRHEIGNVLGSDSCIFGVKSVSVYLYNSKFHGSSITAEEVRDKVDLSQPVAFLVHGFISSGNTSNLKELASRLTEKGYTVLAVDWSQGACTNGIPIVKLVEYPGAVQNTREIGEHVASYVAFLIRCGVPLKKITFIGHSLGAHVSGFAAKKFRTLGHGSIPLIIAADPAAPLFDIRKCEDRLCQSDADFVKVLHTSTLGIPYPLGDLDLDFNNGKYQPGCGIDIISCSHSRSVTYISDMLKGDCGFPGVSEHPSLLSFKSSPSYPDSSATDCIFLNSNILDSHSPIKGQYYVFVEENSDHCTRETFSNCQQ